MTSPRDTPDLDLMTTKEVAVMLRVPENTVRYWRAQKTGPTCKAIGKYVLYERADVVRWYDQQ